MPLSPNGRYFFYAYIFAQNTSNALVLTDAMKAAMLNAGLATTFQEVGKNVGANMLSMTTTTFIANTVAASASPPGVQSPFLHITLTYNDINAALTPQDQAFRGAIVFLFYTTCGICSFVGVEASGAMGAAATLIAQFMVANSFLLILPSHYSISQKSLATLLASGLLFRIAKFSKKLVCRNNKKLGSKKRAQKRSFLELQKTYLKIALLAVNNQIGVLAVV